MNQRMIILHQITAYEYVGVVNTWFSYAISIRIMIPVSRIVEPIVESAADVPNNNNRIDQVNILDPLIETCIHKSSKVTPAVERILDKARISDWKNMDFR